MPSQPVPITILYWMTVFYDTDEDAHLAFPVPVLVIFALYQRDLFVKNIIGVV